jgi:hypothetical protein
LTQFFRLPLADDANLFHALAKRLPEIRSNELQLFFGEHEILPAFSRENTHIFWPGKIEHGTEIL